MDLKSYAVLRKIANNSEMLEYVVSNKPVPIEILDKDMAGLIQDLHEPQAEMIVSDYRRYLRENTKVGIVREDKDEFAVDGEIDEPVIQSIELVHQVNREDVVTDLVTSVMSDMSQDRSVEVELVEIQKSAYDFANNVKSFAEDTHDEQPEEVVQSPEQVIESPVAKTPTADEAELERILNESPQPIPEVQPEQEVQPEVQPEQDVVAQPEAKVAENVSDADMDDLLNNAMAEQEVTEPEPEPVEESPVPEEDLSVAFVDQSLPGSDIELEEPMFEDPDAESEPADTTEAKPEQDPLENPFRKARDYLIQELRAHHIDERLPGLHIA